MDLDYANFNRINQIQKNFKTALQSSCCKYCEKIELFFAIMKIEAWVLAFTPAISKWAAISENQVLDLIKKESPACNLEEIRNPASLLSSIGKKRGKDHKTYHEMMSLVSTIDRDMILNVQDSSWVPSFNQFWDKLISACGAHAKSS